MRSILTLLLVLGVSTLLLVPTSGPGTPVAHAAPDLTWPFEPGRDWIISNGYHQGYSFDLVVADNPSDPYATKDMKVTAAADGTVVDAAGFAAGQPVVCVNITGTGMSYLVAHVKERIPEGTRVIKGETLLAKVEEPKGPAVLPGNNWFSHIHFGLYSQPGCVNGGKTPPYNVDADLPFSATGGQFGPGLNIDGVAYPAPTWWGGQYYGTVVRRTAQPGQDPVAEANGPYPGMVGQEITFSAAGSHDPDGTIVSYAWDFGDGTSGSGATPSHPYNVPGSFVATLTVTDNSSKTATDTASVTVVGDTTPPVTTIHLNPPTPNGNNDWYVSPVDVTISAEDNAGGTGVAWTQYRLDGGPWQGYTGQFTLGEGITLIEARSADNAGNVEDPPVSKMVKIDLTAPNTTPTLDPPVPNGKRGWYISDVTVCLNPSDPDLADGSPGSGVDVTRYRVNGGAWQDYAGCFVVGTESWDNDIDFYSTDNASNVEPEDDVHFKLDKTPPDLDINDGILDGLHWDQVHLERGVLTNTSSLAASGDGTDNLCLWEVRAVDLDSGQVLDSEQPVSILIFPPPTPASMDYRLDVPLHQGINNIDVVAEDCAGWEKHLPIQVVYVTPGPYDPRSKGFWYNSVNTGKYSEADFQTLLGYVNVVSDVYGPATRNIYGLVSLANYRGILSPVTSDMETLQKAQLLATWLNLVSGRVAVLTPADLTKVKGWAQVVDNTGGSPLTFALNVPMEAEEVDQTRMAGRDVYEVAKNLLDAFNNRMIIP